MADRKSGGCQCGQIRYEIVGKPLRLAICHCRDCQKQSSSAFGMSLTVHPQQFQITKGAVKRFEWRCDSGRTKSCTFCPNCGTRITHESDGSISVKAGSLDDTSGLHPDAHYWTARRQKWFDISPDLPHYADDG